MTKGFYNHWSKEQINIIEQAIDDSIIEKVDNSDDYIISRNDLLKILDLKKVPLKEKKLCPNCKNIKLSFIKGTKNRIVNTLDGLQEWSFNSKYFCRKCGFEKNLQDIIKNDEKNNTKPRFC